MIFPSSDEKERVYWNHDVHFPLDLIFLDGSGAVVSIKRLETFSDRNVSSDAAAQYAIELNAGSAQRLHVEVGQHLEIPKEALRPPAAK
jgi:uncharacterized membrane protein (UPF0127 family)